MNDLPLSAQLADHAATAIKNNLEKSWPGRFHFLVVVMDTTDTENMGFATSLKREAVGDVLQDCLNAYNKSKTA